MKDKSDINTNLKMDHFLKPCEELMEKKLEHLDRDLQKTRTGRASTSILDGIRVDYYGTPTPLNQVASLSTPDARTIVISPFEKKLAGEIEKAIQIADVGIQPNNDGNVIRLPIPPLNEDRRKKIAKEIKKLGEDSKVSIRLVRQDINNKIKKTEKAKDINKDDSAHFQKEIQECTDRFIKKVTEKVALKEKEILSF